MKTIIVILLSFILAGNVLPQQEKILEIGEELNYSVYYGFIKLGEVKFKITGKNKEGKKELFTAIASIKSFDAIPLVNINYIFESQMDYLKGEVHSINLRYGIQRKINYKYILYI